MHGDKYKQQGKHKHWERGSLEEENRKRLNMAFNDAELPDDETSEAQEPSNPELKEMLVDIKMELSNIARENNNLPKKLQNLEA